MDISDIVSAGAAAVSAYAAWKSIQTEKAVQEFQQVKLSAKIKDVTYYTGIPDIAYHKFNLDIMNTSPNPVVIKEIGPLSIHSHTYTVSFPENVVLNPFVLQTIACSVSCYGKDILDGRYPMDISIKTDRSTHAFHFDWDTCYWSFRSEPYKD